jgi:cytoskeletal protein CcmA (bactofilin family)
VSDKVNGIGTHLDEITLLLYVERQLDREAAHEVSLHTQTCEKCLTLLRALDRESRLLTRSMLEQDEPLPARIAEFQAKVKRSMQWIWGLVFGMALLGVYSLYTGYIEDSVQKFEQAGFGSTDLLSLLVFQGAFWKGWQSMFTLAEFAALASSAVFAIFILRKYVKRGASLAVMFASFGLLLAIAPAAPAQDLKVNVDDFEGRHPSLEIKKDEVVKHDIFAVASQLRIDGTVDGDVYTLAQDIDVTGHVTGDIICAARSVRITGQVDGNVRCADNNISISGTIGKNATVAAEDVHLASSASIGHNFISAGQVMNLDGTVGRDVYATFTEGTLAGTVGGNFNGVGHALNISSSARVDGKTWFKGETPANVSAGAKLASPVEFTKFEHKSRAEQGGLGYYIWRVIWAGARILLGLVLISLMPVFAKETIESAERYGAALGLGVLTLFGVGIASFIACVTIVGLLVGVSTLFLWLVSIFSSYVVVGAVVGRWILGKSNEFWPGIGRMALGVLIVILLVTVPHVGGWIRFGVWIWGVGAISLALYRRFQPIIAPNIPSMPSGPIGTPLPPTTTVSPA